MQATFNVPAIHCNHCAHTIKLEVGELLGVKDVAVDVAEKSVSVDFDTPASEESIKSLLAEIGYPAA